MKIYDSQQRIKSSEKNFSKDLLNFVLRKFRYTTELNTLTTEHPTTHTPFVLFNFLIDTSILQKYTLGEILHSFWKAAHGRIFVL